MAGKISDAAPSSCGVDHATLRKLGTGVYEDVTGKSLHLCLVEICAEAGYAPTQENLDIAESALREVVAEKWPGLPIMVATDEPRAGDKVH